MARAFLKRGQPGTTLMMILAANAPDVDVISLFGGGLSYLEYHRGYTHSLAGAPVMALAVLLAAHLLGGARITWTAYWACVAGVLSHLLLDWTNVYGIRMLLPFSAHWLRLDITDIVDPWILLILFAAVAAPALAGLVSSEIASRRMPAPVRGWAQVALAAVLLFEGGRWVLHQRANAVLGAHTYAGALPARVVAIPSRFNPLAWRGVVETAAVVYDIPVDLSGEFDPSAGRADYPAAPSPAIEAALRTRPFRIFANFSQLPFWRIVPAPDGTQVELIDLRFGTPQMPGFEAVARLDQGGRVLDSGFGFGRLR